MINFETSVRIERTVEEVFGFASEPLNFPLWNFAVQTVRRTSGSGGEAGSTYLMERELATGRVVNGLEIFAREQPSEFSIRTISGPTPFIYRYRFASEGSSTMIHLSAEVELGLPGVLGPLATRRVKRGVDANFAALKQTLETAARGVQSG